MSAEPVTVTVAHRVTSGYEDEFALWASTMLAQASDAPGYLGGGILGARQGEEEWHIVYRFEDPVSALRWEDSRSHFDWARHTAGFAPQTEVRRAFGLHAWFDSPGRPAAPPPKWKMALVTLSAVFPPVLVFNMTIIPFLGGSSVVLRTLALCMAVTAVVTWIMMPRLTALLKTWLYPDTAGRHRRPASWTVQSGPARRGGVSRGPGHTARPRTAGRREYPSASQWREI